MHLAGEISVKANGEVYWAKGNFTYNSGELKREPIYGANGRIQGYKTVPNDPTIEGELTDYGTFKLKSLVTLKDATVTLDLANGKTFILRQAWYSGDGNVSTDEATINFKVTSKFPGEEIR